MKARKTSQKYSSPFLKAKIQPVQVTNITQLFETGATLCKYSYKFFQNAWFERKTKNTRTMSTKTDEKWPKKLK